jgi:hypothetical protein
LGDDVVKHHKAEVLGDCARFDEREVPCGQIDQRDRKE